MGDYSLEPRRERFGLAVSLLLGVAGIELAALGVAFVAGAIWWRLRETGFLSDRGLLSV